MDANALRKGFGSAAGRKAQLAAYHDALNKAADEIDRLRDALSDCASGLRYVRETCGELYGVGFDRALGKADAALTPN